jgi:hypothetical protein
MSGSVAGLIGSEAINKKHPYKKLFDVVACVVLLHTGHAVHNLSTIII